MGDGDPTGASAPSSAPAPPATDGRVMSLSDGVFAFALTLIALTLTVPTPGAVPAAELVAAVRRQLPEFASYALSFWVVISFWFAHRRLFRRVVADDGPTGWCNALFLFGIAFLPYPRDMVGTYSTSRFAIAVYDASMVAPPAEDAGERRYRLCLVYPIGLGPNLRGRPGALSV